MSVKSLAAKFGDTKETTAAKARQELQQIAAQSLEKQEIVVTADVIIIVNQQNKPIRLLHDVKCNITTKSMEFSSHQPYESQDMQKLQALGAKTGAFLITPEWKIAIPDLDKVKQTICYGFKSQECRALFFHQSYDFAVVFNIKNQMKVLLSDITYNYLAHSIHFKSATLYRGGYYEALGKHAQKVKLITASEYRQVDNDANINHKYVFDEVEEKDGSVFQPQRCLLWTLDTKNFDGWLEYVHSQSAEFDAGVLQNERHENLYFFNKLCINYLENFVQAAMMEPFSDGKHNALISKFGVQRGQPVKLKNFKLPNLGNDAKEKAKCKYLVIYTWDMNKPQYVEQDDEDEDGEAVEQKEEKRQRLKLKTSKSVDFDQAKKDDEKKKKAKAAKGAKSKNKGKSGKTQTDKKDANNNNNTKSKKSKNKKKDAALSTGSKPSHKKTKSALPSSSSYSKKKANEKDAPKLKNKNSGHTSSKNKSKAHAKSTKTKNNMLTVDMNASVPPKRRPGHKKASKSISPTSPNELTGKKSLKLKNKSSGSRSGAKKRDAGGLKVSTPKSPGRHKKAHTAMALPSKAELNGKKKKKDGKDKEEKKKKKQKKGGRDEERTIQPSVARRLSKENKKKLKLPDSEKKSSKKQKDETNGNVEQSSSSSEEPKKQQETQEAVTTAGDAETKSSEIGKVQETEQQDTNPAVEEQSEEPKEMETEKSVASDIGPYESWEWKQILQWILSLEDGMFAKYKSVLEETLSEEEPEGKDLKTVTGDDIKRWGIKKYSDLKAVLSHIQQLVNG